MINGTQHHEFKASTTQAKARKPKAKASPFVEHIDTATQLPSSTRVFCATVGGLLAYAGSYYFAMAAVDVIVTAAMVYTGPGFIAFMIAFIGCVIAIVGAARLGFKVGMFILDADWSEIKGAGSDVYAATQRKVSMVRGWFVRDSDTASEKCVNRNGTSISASTASEPPSTKAAQRRRAASAASGTASRASTATEPVRPKISGARW